MTYIKLLRFQLDFILLPQRIRVIYVYYTIKTIVSSEGVGDAGKLNTEARKVETAIILLGED
jgi:hypothetical protein